MDICDEDQNQNGHKPPTGTLPEDRGAGALPWPFLSIVPMQSQIEHATIWDLGHSRCTTPATGVGPLMCTATTQSTAPPSTTWNASVQAGTPESVVIELGRDAVAQHDQ